MARKFKIAEDLFKHCGADITVQKLAEYQGVSPKTASRRLAGLPRYCGKAYRYEDVAAMIWQSKH